MRVLQQFTRSGNSNDWTIEKLGEGVQANVYVARSKNQQPIWQSLHCLVVKLYKPSAGSSVERAHKEFTSLSQLHSAVDGKSIEGWNTIAPKPLCVCEAPLALVMTMVSGKELDWYLETGNDVTPELLVSAAHSVVAAMKEYWGHAQIYGALSFCNILCDIEARELSFLDAGVESDFFLCEGVAKRWYPASRDLAYILYQTELRVRTSIFNPGSRKRQKLFTYAVLRSFIDTIDSPEEKQFLLDEIQACQQIHLEMLDVSWSPRGLWRMVSRQVASRRIGAMLAKLRADDVTARPQLAYEANRV